MRAVCCVFAVLALAFAPSAAAHRLVSVGYRSASALHGLRVVQRIDALHVAEVRVASRAFATRLRARPGIRFVQGVHARVQTGGPVAPAAAVVPEWQWTAAHEDLVPAWVQQAASNLKIAVVDTGADLTVPALADKSVITWNVTTGTSTVHDQVGHGTFVASLAAGSIANPTDMLGFGGAAQLMVVQANRGSTGFSDIDEANAIVWAVDHGANIVNLSLGGSQTSLAERYAIDYAVSRGVLLVAAAGNSAQQGNPVVYPAALIARQGLVVGAADATGARAAFSSTGSYVDVLAPGVDVLGAVASGIQPGFFTPAQTPGAAGTYGYGSGTSYASPEVAGAAALVWAANPGLNALGVAQAIESTASGNGNWTDDAAYGNVNVAAAVQRALGGPAPALAIPNPKIRPTQLKPPTRAKTAPASAKRRPKAERPR